MNKEKMIIIDGNSLMYRAFYGMPPLTNAKGLHTNVILGFVNMITKIKELHEPHYFVVAFDRKAPTFRHKEYAEYKAGRQKMPEEMVEQIPVLKEVLNLLKVKQLEIDGYEADDIIGTIAKSMTEQKIETLIVTGDKDAFQLINEYVHVLYNKRGISDLEELDEAALFEKYQVTPAQIVDLKALMGDPSDNIPGVPGVGEKTAIDLIKTFGGLDKIYEKSEEITKKGVREKIQNNKEIAYLSHKLATICCEVPISFKLEECTLQEPEGVALGELYMELGFKSLLAKMKSTQQISVPKIEVETLVGFDIKLFVDDVIKNKKLHFKIYEDTLYAKDKEKVVCFVLNEESLGMIKTMMEDSLIKKYGYDLKADNLYLRHKGILLEGEAFDIAIASYLINPSKNTYLESDYASSKEELVLQLPSITEDLMKILEEYDMVSLFEEVEMPLVNILADMEYLGFAVDKEILEKLGKEFGEKLDGLVESIYFMAGETFNINSPKQLGVILFEKLELPTGKKNKTGYSTNVEVLEGLKDKHDIIEKILDYRTLSKLKSTYIDGLLAITNNETGRIYSKLNQLVTATGRLSSTEPNLQNIPIRTAEGREIRKAFVAKPGYVLVDADYSQIELRVLAHIAKDQNMITAFKNKIDIHTKTAAEVFGVDTDQVTSTMRGRAKAVNFGIVYGLSDFGLGKDLGIPRKEAKTYIENYFKQFPGVQIYINKTIEEAKTNGYVTTILNRRRVIEEIKSPNAIMRGMGERIAMNTPIQGSAADIIKIAMVKVHKALESQGLESKLILQVHDELIIETKIEELQQVKELIHHCMESAVVLQVPVVVEVHSGDNWNEAH